VTRICLDTSAYSHFKRGDRAAVAAISAARWIGMPAVVIGELRAGFRLGTRAQRNEGELTAFLADPIVSVLSVDAAASDHYADIVVALRRKGTPLPTNDIWIASVAAREGATVLTYDCHFDEIDRVGSIVLAREA
jgi:tRNA(fMet)-specific endonuclease VapC